MCVCVIIYSCPATYGPIRPRQLLVFLLWFTLLLLGPVPNVQGPAWAGAAVIAGLPRVPEYLKKPKQKERDCKKKTNKLLKRGANNALEAAPSSALPFSVSQVGGPGPPSSPSTSTLVKLLK